MHDIHTHLYWHTYDHDRGEVIARAKAVGIEKMFVVGCTVEESRQAVTLAEQYESLYASVGIHPNFFSDLVEKEFSIHNSQFSIKPQFFNDKIQKLIEELKELAQRKKVVAIGECGLEYFSHDKTKPITDEQKMWQRQGFVAQVKLAIELGLPLIVHARGETGVSVVYEDLYKILKGEGQYLKAIILHCYMGDTEVTKKLLSLPNVYFSFTGNITYPVKKAVMNTKDDLTETVKLVSRERMFVETDCPFLAPQEKRGERNEPANVVVVQEAIARIQGIDSVVVGKSIDDNVRRVFE